MAYQTIPPSSGGSCASDPWGDAAASFVAGKVSTLANIVFRSPCELVVATAGAAGGGSMTLERAAVSGTGADAAIDPTKNGGVIKFTTGTTGSSFRVVRNFNGVAAAGLRSDLIASIRLSKWAKVVRCLIGVVGAGTTMQMLKVTDEATANADVIVGVDGATSTTNWAIKVGAAAYVDSGVALPTVAFATIALIADGTNVSVWNVDTGVQIGANIAQVGAGAVAGHLAMLATDSGITSRSAWVDDVMFITEAAA
jgi:hypothetical protein